MSLDLTFYLDNEEVFDINITHNLNKMADAGGFYYAVWRPEECGIETASQLEPHVRRGLADMIARPDFYKEYDSPNGWGVYPDFLRFMWDLLKACEEYPSAIVIASR